MPPLLNVIIELTINKIYLSIYENNQFDKYITMIDATTQVLPNTRLKKVSRQWQDLTKWLQVMKQRWQV